MRVDDVLSRLEGVRRAGGGWLAKCPAHDDQRQSLSVGEGADGRVLVKCHAGCGLDAILGGVGLELSALFEEGSAPSRREVACYDYRGADGALRYQVVRFEPKDFRQRRPDGAGGWVWNLRDVERVLYRLPELQGQLRVVVVEGEKDADRLWSAGIPATTNVGGAGKWRDAYTAQLLEAGVSELVIVPDADEPGRAHAATVATAWAPKPSRVLTLPDVPPKGDVSDYLARHSVTELRDLLDPPAQKPEPPVWFDARAQWEALRAEDEEAATGRRIHLGLGAIDTTIDGIRRGEVVGILARPGIGKTLILTHVTHGVGDLDTVGHVFFSLEMPASQIVARLQQRLYNIGRNTREDDMRSGRLNPERYFETFGSLLIVDTPGLSVAQMEAIVARAVAGPFREKPLGLITIDHLGLIGGDRKMTTYDRVSVQAREIKELAKRHQCAVLLAVQVNREAGGDGSRELGLGSARDSGVVEEAMDYMIGMRRLDRSLTLSSLDRERYKNVLFLKVIKNRHGDTDTRETAFRFSPVGLWLHEDPTLEADENDVARIASMGGRR